MGLAWLPVPSVCAGVEATAPATARVEAGAGTMTERGMNVRRRFRKRGINVSLPCYS